jgi:hypothetical protein
MLLNLIKLKLQSAAGYKSLLLVKFDINYIDGSAIMHTMGIDVENKEKTSSSSCKLSDAQDFTDIVTSQLQKILQYDTMNVIYLTLDFKEKKVTAEVYYIKQGKKLKAIENIKI